MKDVGVMVEEFTPVMSTFEFDIPLSKCAADSGIVIIDVILLLLSIVSQRSM